MYSLLAQAFASRGHVVVIPNYSLYPIGCVGAMAGDVEGAVRWLAEGGAARIDPVMVRRREREKESERKREIENE